MKEVSWVDQCAILMTSEGGCVLGGLGSRVGWAGDLGSVVHYPLDCGGLCLASFFPQLTTTGEVISHCAALPLAFFRPVE